jgi:hypothetical protein
MKGYEEMLLSLHDSSTYPWSLADEALPIPTFSKRSR